jgi:hypothetical protein
MLPPTVHYLVRHASHRFIFGGEGQVLNLTRVPFHPSASNVTAKLPYFLLPGWKNACPIVPKHGMIARVLTLRRIDESHQTRKVAGLQSEVRRDNAFSSPGMLPLLAKHSLFSF